MKSICKNIAFSPNGDCILFDECICKKNELFISDQPIDKKPEKDDEDTNDVEELRGQRDRILDTLYISEDHVRELEEEIARLTKERDTLIGNDSRQEAEIARLREEASYYRKGLDNLIEKFDAADYDLDDIKLLIKAFLSKYPKS